MDSSPKKAANNLCNVVGISLLSKKKRAEPNIVKKTSTQQSSPNVADNRSRDSLLKQLLIKEPTPTEKAKTEIVRDMLSKLRPVDPLSLSGSISASGYTDSSGSDTVAVVVDQPEIIGT